MRKFFHISIIYGGRFVQRNLLPGTSLKYHKTVTPALPQNIFTHISWARIPRDSAFIPLNHFQYMYMGEYLSHNMCEIS